MPRLAGDIPYRLLGGGQPTQSTNRSNSALVNPQSKSHHNASMSFDGVSDYGRISSVVDLEITNAWTVMVWVTPGNLAPPSEQQIYGIGPLSTPKDNGIELVIEAGGVFAARMYNSNGTLIKKRSLAADGFFFGNSWHQIVVTWDGATMRVYRNGVFMNDDMVNETDIGGGQLNTNRSITLGSSFYPVVGNKMFGLMHSAAHWSEPLTAAAVIETYNSGVGGDFDLNLGQGDYTQQANLKSWYQLASTPSEALLQNKAPGGFELLTTQVSESVVNSAPEGSFFNTAATNFYVELAELQGVGNAMTVAAWVRPDSLPAEGVTQDVCRFTRLVQDELALGITTSGGVSYWVYEVSDTDNLVVNTVVGTTPVVAGAWYHILGCKNDTFTIRFFVNGLDDIAPIVAGIAVTSNVARFTGIAVDLNGVNDIFDGDIDTIALWDVPLSENSVKAVYNGGWRNIDLRSVTPSYSEADRLVQWWRFGSTALNEPLNPQQMVPTGYEITLPDGLDQSSKLKIGTSLLGNCATFDDASGIGTATALPVGVADTFTISMWLKPNNITTDTQYPLYIGPEQPSTLNSITWKLDGDVADDPFVIEVISSGGVTLKRTSYVDLLEVDSWQNLIMVWTGSVLALYHNGTLVVGAVEESNAGSVIDSSRFVDIGGSTRVLAAPAGLKFDGRISHVGFWNVALTPNAIRTVSSQALNLDLRYNKDDYEHAQYLQHYWKMGEDRFGTGRDFMDTARGNNLLPLTAVTGTVSVLGDSPENKELFSFAPHTVSVALDGSTEHFLNSTEQILSIGNVWSIGIWVKPQIGALNNNGTIMKLRQEPGGNQIIFETRGGDSSGRIRWQTAASNGSAIKLYEWNTTMVQDTWEFYVATWDGTSLVVYRNGVDLGAPDIVTWDFAGTMTDGTRQVSFGATNLGTEYVECLLHSSMVWDTELSSSEVAAVYNGGNGADFDAETNSGSYSSSADLVHWWRFGFNRARFGQDFASNGVPIDVGVNAVGLDFQPGFKMVDFNPFEWLESLGGAPVQIGIANTWTIYVWWKPIELDRFPFVGDAIFAIREPAPGSDSDIMLSFDFSSQHFQIRIDDDDLSPFKQYQWPAPAVLDVWTNLVVTWDGAIQSLRLYQDGTEIIPIVVVDTGGAFGGVIQVDRPRIITLTDHISGASDGSGKMHSAAIWNTALGPLEITTIYNGGDGAYTDLTSNFDNYSSATNLRNWYRLGFLPDPDIGKDYASSSPILNLTSGGPEPIDDTDVFEDSPSSGGPPPPDPDIAFDAPT